MASSTKRTKRLVRLLDIFQQQERSVIADLEAQMAAAEQTKTELMTALNADSALHGIFVDVIAQRMRRLTREEARLKTDRDGAFGRLQEHTSRSNKAADLLQSQTQNAERQDEKKSLEQLLEWSTGATQGLGKSSRSP